jgi:hypothetical protein
VTAWFSGIEIVGRDEFVKRTWHALTLADPSPTFREVRLYLSGIREARRSGMLVRGPRPTFCVGEPTWRSDPMWYASCIVHDAFHAKLYRDGRRRFLGLSFTPVREYHGKEAERKCMAVQLRALREMGGDTAMEDYLLSQMENPTHQDRWIRRW